MFPTRVYEVVYPCVPSWIAQENFQRESNRFPSSYRVIRRGTLFISQLKVLHSHFKLINEIFESIVTGVKKIPSLCSEEDWHING